MLIDLVWVVHFIIDWLIDWLIQCHCSHGVPASISASGMWNWEAVMTQRLFNHVSTGITWYVFNVICDSSNAVHQNLLVEQEWLLE